MIAAVWQVALGGALGAVARFGVVQLAARLWGPGFPWGTLAVNVAGSLAMGVLAVVLLAPGQGPGSGAWAPFLLAGVLGGFTTFSAFSLDAVGLWQGDAPGLAVVYVLVSVLAAVLALGAGMVLARGLLA